MIKSLSTVLCCWTRDDGSCVSGEIREDLFGKREDKYGFLEEGGEGEGIWDNKDFL